MKVRTAAEVAVAPFEFHAFVRFGRKRTSRPLRAESAPRRFFSAEKEVDVGRIIVANRRGHQVVAWETTDTEEARATVTEAERIIREARASGCAVSKKVDGVHVLDREPFDPQAEEYQIIAPIAGG